MQFQIGTTSERLGLGNQFASIQILVKNVEAVGVVTVLSLVLGTAGIGITVGAIIGTIVVILVICTATGTIVARRRVAGNF